MGKTKGNAKQKLGKNKKKTWKQIRHDDVEEFLDDVRQDERLGGIRAKTNDQLFALDNVGISGLGFDLDDNDISHVQVQNSTKSESESDDESGPLVRLDKLRCFQLQKPHSSVRDPIIKRNRLRIPGEKKSLKMVIKDNLRLCKKTIVEPKTKEVVLDPWEDKQSTGVLDSEWVHPSIKRHNIKHVPIRNKKHVTSLIPAVEAPHPGFSYNPTFKDHQDLLRTATEIEAEKVHKEEKLIRATAPTKCNSVDIDDVLRSNSMEEEEESTGEIEDVKDIKPIINPRFELKTKKKRRKEKEEIEKKRLVQIKKLENARLNEVYRIKTIQKEIASDEKKQKERHEKISQLKDNHEKFGQKELGKLKYEAPPLNPVLSDELQGSLIGIPSTNTLLADRFNSLQKRNILEPRLKAKVPRKNRVKKFIRASDKMEWEKTGFWNGIRVAK